MGCQVHAYPRQDEAAHAVANEDNGVDLVLMQDLQLLALKISSFAHLAYALLLEALERSRKEVETTGCFRKENRGIVAVRADSSSGFIFCQEISQPQDAVWRGECVEGIASDALQSDNVNRKARAGAFDVGLSLTQKI